MSLSIATSFNTYAVSTIILMIIILLTNHNINYIKHSEFAVLIA